MHSEEENRTKILEERLQTIGSLSFSSGKAAVPDIDGCVGQDLTITVPAAIGAGTATSGVVSADLAENLPFAVPQQLQL